MNEHIQPGQRFEYIEIAFLSGRVKQVDAWIFGQVAVHKQDNPFGVEAYTITHLKTGQAAAALNGLYGYGVCVEWAKALAEVDIDKYMDDYQRNGVYDQAVFIRLGEIAREVCNRYPVDNVRLVGYPAHLPREKQQAVEITTSVV